MNFLINYIYLGSNVTCQSIIEPELLATIQMFFNIFQIIIPVLILILSAVDFIVAIAGSDDKKMKEATGKLVKRLLMAALFALLPALINLLLSWINTTYTTCGIGFL